MTQENVKLENYDIILVNSSGGKDSVVTLDVVCTEARCLDILDRVHVVHCDLKRMEWRGTRDLVERQVARYSLSDRLHVVSRPQGDILDHVRDRFQKLPHVPSWPRPTVRFCTSDHKRDQIGKVVTKLSRSVKSLNGKSYIVKALVCIGMRSEESPSRSKMTDFARDKRWTNKGRTVDTWLAIHKWTTEEVWDCIKSKGLPYHYAYDLGMPRLSCAICIFSPRKAIALAAQHNRPLLDEMCKIEQETGYTFRADLSLTELRDGLDAGTEPVPGPNEIQSWVM